MNSRGSIHSAVLHETDEEKAGHASAFSFSPDFSLEKPLLSMGPVAGIDEAGRGALAGPLSVGLVIFPESVIKDPPDEIFNIINDSKKLSPRKRKKSLDYIRSTALYSDVVLVSHVTVDSLNVNRATECAIKRLLKRCSQLPGTILLDGNFRFQFSIPCQPVKKGDSRSLSIAAASILAKVTRDEIMDRLDLRYPGYEFREHKGYGTLCHRGKIFSMGPCPIHRRSYEPVKGLVSNENSLFPEETPVKAE